MSLYSQDYTIGTQNGTPQTDDRKSEPPLAPLIQRPQWVVWRLEIRDDKPAKIPYTPTTRTRASATGPETWGTYDEAAAAVGTGRFAGIGFVFAPDGGLFGVDLDDCRDPETGALETWAEDIVDRFATYTEPSPSGTGVHIIGHGTKPATNSRKGKHIECYDRARFFTMTMHPLAGHEQIRDCGDVLTAWHREVWPPAPTTAPSTAPATTLEERDVIERIEREESGIGAALLRGDHSGYPSPSEALYGLASRCLFYGANESTIASICQASGLFKPGTTNREKERKAARAAEKILADDTGERYDPDRWRRAADRLTFGRGTGEATAPEKAPGEPEPQTIEELHAALRAEKQKTAALEAERDAYRDHFHALMDIISIPTMDDAPKIVAIGTFLTGIEFKEDPARHVPSPRGDYHMPASWIGRYCGKNEQAVNRGLKVLEGAGLIDRDVRNHTEMRTVEHVDSDGVLERDTYQKRGKRSYITLPDNVIDMASRFQEYQKPEDAPKRGGARVRDCAKHPGAELIQRTAYYCEGCFHEYENGLAPMPEPLDWGNPTRTKRSAPETESESSFKDECTTPPVVIGSIKDECDPRTEAADAGAESSPFKLERYPAPRCEQPECTALAANGRTLCEGHLQARISQQMAEHNAMIQSRGEVAS